MKSLPHDCSSGHKAWNEGRYDQWLEAKGHLTMGHLIREDIPFHHALADAFTICDAYFSSIHGPTCPNRLFMLTGSNDPLGKGGGPVTDNNNITQLPDGVDIYEQGWVTYAERLQSAGIHWQCYRQGVDPRSDDDSDGAMNLLLAFSSFINAKPGDPLYERGVAPRRLEQLKFDVLSGNLAQVS
jgi:phospholipase C